MRIAFLCCLFFSCTAAATISPIKEDDQGWAEVYSAGLQATKKACFSWLEVFDAVKEAIENFNTYNQKLCELRKKFDPDNEPVCNLAKKIFPWQNNGMRKLLYCPEELCSLLDEQELQAFLQSNNAAQLKKIAQVLQKLLDALRQGYTGYKIDKDFYCKAVAYYLDSVKNKKNAVKKLNKFFTKFKKIEEPIILLGPNGVFNEVCLRMTLEENEFFCGSLYQQFSELLFKIKKTIEIAQAGYQAQELKILRNSILQDTVSVLDEDNDDDEDD